MLAAAGFTPLLVPSADGVNKNCVAWKVEKTAHYFVHADKVTADSSTDKGKEPRLVEGCLIWDVAQPLYKLHRKFLNTV